MAIIFIDDEQGFDATEAQGTEASPFQSLPQATRGRCQTSGGGGAKGTRCRGSTSSGTGHSRRGLSLMQCLLFGQLAKTHDALTLVRETSMGISGELWELHADYFRIISKAPGGDESFTNKQGARGR